MSSVDVRSYLVTDARHAAKHGRSVDETVALAVAGGVSVVQVREKSLPDEEFVDVVCRVVDAAGGVPVLVNDRVPVFLAARRRGVRVAGVHCGQGDLPAKQVRDAVGGDAVVGITAATSALIAQAVASGVVDYVGAGPVHTTVTKADAAKVPLGYRGVAELVASAQLPVVAIGGIEVSDVVPLRRVGVAGVAFSGAVCGASDVTRAAAGFAAEWVVEL